MFGWLPQLNTQEKQEFRHGVTDIAPQLVGTLPFGLVTGIAGVAAGLTPGEAIGLSFACYSGVAQLVVSQLHASSAPMIITLCAVAVVSARLIMYSASLAPFLAHLPRGWRWLLAYVLTDQGFARGSVYFAKNTDPSQIAARHWYFLGMTVPMYALWQASVSVGAILGTQIPAAWSLDFAVTLSFLILLKPAIKHRADLAAAIVAAAVVLVFYGLPYRLSLLLASLAGITCGLIAERALLKATAQGAKA